MSALPEALLMDQDGTTVNTEPLWEASESALVTEMGGVLTPEVRRQMIGEPLEVTVRLMNSVAANPRDEALLREQLIERMATLIDEGGAPFFPGVAPLVARMRADGVPIAMVTATVRRIAGAVAAACPGGGFDLLVTGDDVSRAKPDPEPYLLAASRLGVDITRCLVVEDSVTGLTAASRAGAIPVAIPCEVPIPEDPRWSRVKALEDLDRDLVARLMAGERVDLLSS